MKKYVSEYTPPRASDPPVHLTTSDDIVTDMLVWSLEGIYT